MKIKKFLALALVLCMLSSMVTPAFAEGEGFVCTECEGECIGHEVVDETTTSAPETTAAPEETTTEGTSEETTSESTATDTTAAENTEEPCADCTEDAKCE